MRLTEHQFSKILYDSISSINDRTSSLFDRTASMYDRTASMYDRTVSLYDRISRVFDRNSFRDWLCMTEPPKNVKNTNILPKTPSSNGNFEKSP